MMRIIENVFKMIDIILNNSQKTFKAPTFKVW